MKNKVGGQFKSKYVGDKHPIFCTLSYMKKRCYNNKTKSWKHYEGKGIVICKEWLDDRDSFYLWAMANGWQKGLSIDRIDSNGNYEPSNCRWITKADNNRNVMRRRRGELSPNHSLSNDHIKAARILFKLNFTHQSIANFFGVSRTTITDILSNRYWSHINEEN